MLYPERFAEPAIFAAYERERCEHNITALRWTLPGLALLHAFAGLTFTRLPAATDAQAAWIYWVIRMHAAMTCFDAITAVVAWRGRDPMVRRALGDIAGFVSIVVMGVMSGSAQRVHTNFNAFIVAALASAFVLRLRPSVYVTALALGSAALMVGNLRFQIDPGLRRAGFTSIALADMVSLSAFFANRTIRFRELVARLKIQELNADLERRVEAQVGEIVAHAREIEKLNTQLAEKIRERSRELSMALARLAEGPASLVHGETLEGRVEVYGMLGVGGMGAVYRGKDLVTGDAVAVKIIQPGSAQELDGLYRFLREAEVLASLTHKAIVRSIHLDVSADGRLFQVMELVDGETLAARLTREGPLSPIVTARIGAMLGEALAAAHEAGVIHRDVKPSNVMLTAASPGLKLLDFGISKLKDAFLSGSVSADSKTSGALLGTPEFLAPEQIMGGDDISERADVYSAGLVLYLCIAGRMPFNGTSGRSFAMAHVTKIPDDLAAIAPATDPAIAGLVMRCLDKSPSARPTAAELASSLAVIADAASAPPLEVLVKESAKASIAMDAAPTREVTMPPLAASTLVTSKTRAS